MPPSLSITGSPYCTSTHDDKHFESVYIPKQVPNKCQPTNTGNTGSAHNSSRSEATSSQPLVSGTKLPILACEAQVVTRTPHLLSSTGVTLTVTNDTTAPGPATAARAAASPSLARPHSKPQQPHHHGPPHHQHQHYVILLMRMARVIIACPWLARSPPRLRAGLILTQQDPVAIWQGSGNGG